MLLYSVNFQTFFFFFCLGLKAKGECSMESLPLYNQQKMQLCKSANNEWNRLNINLQLHVVSFAKRNEQWVNSVSRISVTKMNSWNQDMSAEKGKKGHSQYSLLI